MQTRRGQNVHTTRLGIGSCGSYWILEYSIFFLNSSFTSWSYYYPASNGISFLYPTRIIHLLFLYHEEKVVLLSKTMPVHYEQKKNRNKLTVEMMITLKGVLPPL